MFSTTCSLLLHWLNKLSSWICVCNSALITNSYKYRDGHWPSMVIAYKVQWTHQAWIKNSFNVHFSVSDIVTKEVSITLHYITLHYITLHYITLHYITLHYIALHCIALHYITLHYITLHYITLHYITLHYITLHYITLHYITLHYITLHYITLHYITLHYIDKIIALLCRCSHNRIIWYQLTNGLEVRRNSVTLSRLGKQQILVAVRLYVILNYVWKKSSNCSDPLKLFSEFWLSGGMIPNELTVATSSAFQLHWCVTTTTPGQSTHAASEPEGGDKRVIFVLQCIDNIIIYNLTCIWNYHKQPVTSIWI